MTDPRFVAPEVEAAKDAAIPDPLPEILAVLPSHLAQWLAEQNPRPAPPSDMPA